MKAITPFKKILFYFIVFFFADSVQSNAGAQYDSQLDDEITNTAKANDRLYIDMLDVPQSKRLYENYKDRYNEIDAEINSIQLKNEGRQKNGDFLVIIKNLKDGFAEAKKYHKEKNTLSDGEILVYRGTLAGYWKPLYVAERALK